MPYKGKPGIACKADKWTCTLTSGHAMCSITSHGPTLRKAFDNAYHSAGPEFTKYQFPTGHDLYWLDGFYACRDTILKRGYVSASWQPANREMAVTIRRLGR